MKAEYFYNRLLKYDEESRTTGKDYYGYCNGAVNIHRKNDESEYFTIYKNGRVYHHYTGNYDGEWLTVANLEGDNFEIFNIVQIIRSGYLTLNTESELDVKKSISKLYNYIRSFDNGHPFKKTKNIPTLCGGSIWSNGVTDDFQYYSVNGIEVHLQTIKELCKENVNRKHYDLRPIPFIKAMKNTNTIYVSFICIMRLDNDGNLKEKCDSALSDLLTYMDDIDVECKWVECRIRKPVYC